MGNQSKHPWTPPSESLKLTDEMIYEIASSQWWALVQFEINPIILGLNLN